MLSLFECQLETCFSTQTARLPRLIDNLNNLVTKLFWLWVVICVRIGLWSQSWNLVSRLFCKIYKARDWHKHGRQLRITKSVTVTWDERIEALKWFWLVSLVDQLWGDIWLDATDESRESNWQLRTFDIACVSFLLCYFCSHMELEYLLWRRLSFNHEALSSVSRPNLSCVEPDSRSFNGPLFPSAEICGFFATFSA